MMFTLGAVGIARIAIENDRTYSLGYAAVLGLVTFLAMLRFVDSPIFALLILALIAYLSDIIVRDCTLIDDEVDASGQGLVDSGRMFVNEQLQQSSDAVGDSVTIEGESKRPVRKTHQPGRTVMYLALAALPLFGLGQFFLRNDAETWNRAQRLLAFYLFSSLSLLVTTSFLGLRRYLRQRRVDMPVDVSIGWMMGGLSMIAAVLLISYMAPMPGRALATFELPIKLDSPGTTVASRFGWGREGADQASPGAAQTPESNPEKESSGQSYRQGAPPGSVAQGNRKNGPTGNQGGGKSGSQSSASQSSASQSSPSQSSAKRSATGQADSQGQRGQDQSNQPQRANRSRPNQGQSPSPQSQSPQSQSTGRQTSDSESPQGKSAARESGTQAGQQSQSQPPTSTPSDGANKSSSPPNSPSQSSERSSGEADQDRSSNPSPGAESEPNQQSQAQSGEGTRPGEETQREMDDQKTDGNESQDERDDSRADDSSDQRNEQSGRQRSEQGGESQDRSSTGSSILGKSISLISGLIKMVVMLALAAVVLVFLWTNLDRIRQWWESLFGDGDEPADQTADALLNKTIEAPPRPFSSFRNPIGKESDLRRVVVITFQAFEAWARERGTTRSKDETPSEFVRRAAKVKPEASSPAVQIVDAYNRVVYGRGKPTEKDLQAVSPVWKVMGVGGKGSEAVRQ